MPKVAVIGAGISGLICAYELQKAGIEVTVYEKNKLVGGRMCSRIKDGIPFDFGANFFIKHYKETKKYCDELGIEFNPRRASNPYTFRGGKWHRLTFLNIFLFFRFSALSFYSKMRLLYLFMRIKRDVSDLDFFNLCTTIKYDGQNAYEYAKKIAGKEVADVIVDGFISTYQFHGSKELSLGAMLGLMSLMIKNPSGFQICQAPTMIALPEALAKKINVKTKTPISKIESLRKRVVVSYSGKTETFDAVVIATTANITKTIYINPSIRQQSFLDTVNYATTINISYKIPEHILKDVSILTVAHSENQKICEACNEVSKGFVKDGKTLVNIGLHEDYAKRIIHKSDKEIFDLVKESFVDICPYIDDSALLENHDLHRWNQAMPKFSSGYITKVKNFLDNGQGDNNVHFCGDYLNSPWIEGSIRCGKRVAKIILGSLK